MLTLENCLVNDKKQKNESKKDIYARYGIEYDPKKEKILAPIFGWIRPLLINGNDKLGLGVWTYSTLAGNFVYHVMIDGEKWDVRGTCPCNCNGCYAQSGRYNCDNVKVANARKTVLSREHMDFVKAAILAQIEADKIEILRIHASGEFFNREYIQMWFEIIAAAKKTVFWSYTKNREAEEAFNDLHNVNIVKSVIPGYGFNFGKCAYIMKVFHALKAAGKNVHICRCGIDKNQHCTTCHGCINNDYVLFLEHSTNYVAEKDPLYNDFCALVESQEKQ